MRKNWTVKYGILGCINDEAFEEDNIPGNK